MTVGVLPGINALHPTEASPAPALEYDGPLTQETDLSGMAYDVSDPPSVIDHAETMLKFEGRQLPASFYFAMIGNVAAHLVERAGSEDAPEAVVTEAVDAFVDTLETKEIVGPQSYDDMHAIVRGIMRAEAYLLNRPTPDTQRLQALEEAREEIKAMYPNEFSLVA